jgi:TfoX/Sxy family transcriptional regulator of competence genes
MTYNENLAARIRKLLPRAEEKKMFGGIGLMERGHLVAGISREDLIVRVMPEETERWLRSPGAHPMMMRKPMKGWVKVSGSALRDDRTLSGWVDRSRAAAQKLPPK